ncbi:MAG: hypothetical protein Q7P63_10160 [Verrucomicrobiota bacterium JB022]|nr:hypothetical protein [Verrucomicrobiota bacterium JB022]
MRLTIENFPDQLLRRLQQSAAKSGRTLDQQIVAELSPPQETLQRIRSHRAQQQIFLREGEVESIIREGRR